MTKNMPFTLITDKKALNKAISTFAGSEKTLRGKAHVIMCSCLSHAREHGDFTLLTRFLNTVSGSSLHVSGIMRWVRAYTNLSWVKDKGFVKPKDEALAIDLDAAIEKPFWEMVANKEENQPFDFAKSVLRLIAKTEKALEKDDVKDAETVKADLARIKALNIGVVPAGAVAA